MFLLSFTRGEIVRVKWWFVTEAERWWFKWCDRLEAIEYIVEDRLLLEVEYSASYMVCKVCIALHMDSSSMSSKNVSVPPKTREPSSRVMMNGWNFGLELCFWNRRPLGRHSWVTASSSNGFHGRLDGKWLRILHLYDLSKGGFEMPSSLIRI